MSLFDYWHEAIGNPAVVKRENLPTQDKSCDRTDDASLGVSMVKKKTLATKVALAVFFLLGGIEYGVIIPTLWPYLEELGAGHAFYGLTFSAYALSGLVAAMVFGVVSDRLGATKLLVLVATAFQVSLVCYRV